MKRSAIGMTLRECENLRLFESDNPPSILGLLVDSDTTEAVGAGMADRISR
ncbi:MAG: hypothetical protein NTX28_06940 [Novosphingobium sp.]|nr:hypothetical protein [Novosphingobium sp.]